MTKLLTRTLVIFVCLTSLIGGTLFFAHPAHASAVKHSTSTSSSKTNPRYVGPPCYGSSCNGLDPYTTGCANTNIPRNTVREVSESYRNTGFIVNGYGWTAIVGTIYNKYSSWCNANWAEDTMVAPPSDGISIDIHTNNTFQCYPDDCNARYGGSAYPLWTNMVDGTNVATACAFLFNGDINCASQ